MENSKKFYCEKGKQKAGENSNDRKQKANFVSILQYNKNMSFTLEDTDIPQLAKEQAESNTSPTLKAITNTYVPLKICKLIDAAVINVKYHQNEESSKTELQSADIKINFSLPKEVDLEKLTHQIVQSFSISSVITELSIGAIGIDNFDQLSISNSHDYSIIVPLYRGSKDRSLLDRFHSQEKIIQHHCFIIQGINYNYRVRTFINLENNEIATPEVGTTFIDTRRINHVLSNTKLSLIQLKDKTKEMFVSCNERRKKGNKPEQPVYTPLPVAFSQQPTFALPMAGGNQNESNGTPVFNYYLPVQVQSVPAIHN